MWIVRLALRRTYTFIVLAMLIAVVGVLSTQRMSTDIFPEADVPVVSIVWVYSGMPSEEIESRIILVNERVLTASVNDIEHIESQSYTGYGVIRVYFHPGAKVAEAEVQVAGTCQTLLKIMPPGITPPFIVRYSATSVPIMQIEMSSDTLTDQQIFDYMSLLRGIGKRRGHAPGEVAVAWVLHNPAVTGAIVGARRPGQVRGVVGAGGFRLSPREVTEIDAFFAKAAA
ncbi:MAG TPA: efflux RND transporter permease subunit [Gemmataceae bacterium]|nr:efflux RND transporter permease subunit [Gemmataceae bacterium]